MVFDKKMLVLPVDGSEDADKMVRYICFMFGPKQFSQITLLYVMPALPPLLVEEGRKDKQMAARLKVVQERNKNSASEVLAASEKILLDRGFSREQLTGVCIEKKQDIPGDICRWAEKKQADAIAVSAVGRSKLEAFLLGENAAKVIEISREIPVWITKGKIVRKPVMVCVDNSKNAMRAVDHAGFVLSGSDCPVTLFHSKRSLRRFLPKMILETTPDLDEKWLAAAGNDIDPVMAKAKQMLLDAGISASKLSVEIRDGSRNAAADMLNAAESCGAGTLVLGKHGAGDSACYALGSVARKVIENAKNMAVWMVP